MNPTIDLNLLSRGGRAVVAGDAPASQAPSVPVPARKWKTRVLIPAAVLLLAGGMLLWTGRQALWPATPVQVVPVMVKAVGADEGAGNEPSNADSAVGADASAAPTSSAVVVQAPGWVEANPFSVSVSALAEGVVRDVHALEGQPVKKDDVVVRLVDEDARLALDVAEAELAQAEAELQIAEATLRAAQTEWENPIERQRAIDVNKAMVLEADAEHEQFERQVEVEKAKAEELREELERKRQSYAQRAASEFEVVQLELRLKAQAALIESVKAHAGVTHGKVARAAAELKAAEENLRLRVMERKALDEARADLLRTQAAVAKARAARGEAKLQLERMEVRSPIDGVVQERLVEPGMRLMLGSDAPNAATAVRLYDPKRLQVRVDVPLASAARVGVGQQALIVVDVLPDKTFTGTVVRTVHQADLQKNTQQVKVAINDPDAALKPEMLARVKFLAGAAAGSTPPGSAARPGATASSGNTRIYVPEKLLHKHGADHVETWVADQGGTIASQRTVQLGHARMNGWVEVAAGLQPGDRLIVTDARLTNGQRIRITGELEKIEMLASANTNTKAGR